MILPLIFGVVIIGYGVYLYAIGDRHAQESHALGTPTHCLPDEKFECRYASRVGVAVVLLGILATFSFLRA